MRLSGKRLVGLFGATAAIALMAGAIAYADEVMGVSPDARLLRQMNAVIGRIQAAHLATGQLPLQPLSNADAGAMSYAVTGDQRFHLCGTFRLESLSRYEDYALGTIFEPVDRENIDLRKWSRSKGRHCFDVGFDPEPSEGMSSAFTLEH